MKYLQYILHSKFDKYKLKTPLIKVAGTALKDRFDLISIMVIPFNFEISTVKDILRQLVAGGIVYTFAIAFLHR